MTATSRELIKLGWDKHRGNLPSAYLTGLLAGSKAKKAGIGSAILDAGLIKPKTGSAIYAAAKGAIDAGLNVPCSEETFPSEDRIMGKHIEDYKKVKITSKVEEIKNKILKV